VHEVVLQEPVEGAQVGGDHLQQDIAGAGHQVAFHHLVEAADGGLEIAQGLVALPLQLHEDEDGQG
jgi:hypothetical protein